MEEKKKFQRGVQEEHLNAPKNEQSKATIPNNGGSSPRNEVSTIYKRGYETENVGNKIILDLGEVNSHQYKRVRDNNTQQEVKDNKNRYRLIDKINMHGKRFQLNGTLTEIVGDEQQTKHEENV